MITSEKVFEFVEKLRAVVGNKFCDIQKVELEPECGTPGCHAGWAAIALDIQYSGTYEFSDAANQLAVFLGLPDRDSLEIWASVNQDIWGNDWAIGMFCSPEAFGETDYCFPAQVLVDHWQKVGERLKERENAK